VKNIIVFTSSELRHTAFRVFISNFSGINVLKTFSEDGKLLKKKLLKEKDQDINLQLEHLEKRNQYEKKYFQKYISQTQDLSKNFKCPSGFVSTIECLDELKKINPDLIIVYGSSLIKGNIINEFKNKILNVHLGLSPYYRGSGTNYFPFVLNEPEYAGATFMFLDKGVDTGQIIHQFRPRILPDDTFHEIGTRLIKDMFKIYSQIIVNYNIIESIEFKASQTKRLVFKMKDFTPSSLIKLNDNFKNDLIKNYLTNKLTSDKLVPIVQQKWL